MTIQMKHLTINPDAGNSWLDVRDGQFDVTADESFAVDLLAAVRHIMRDRSDCTMIPVVIGAVMGPVNEYGHNFQVEVKYTNRYQAIYGMFLDGNGVSKFCCYMD